MKRKLCIVASARPNFMKIAPIVRVLRERNGKCECILVHTGQRYDRDASSCALLSRCGNNAEREYPRAKGLCRQLQFRGSIPRAVSRCVFPQLFAHPKDAVAAPRYRKELG